MSQINVNTIKNQAGTGGPTLIELEVTNNALVGLGTTAKVGIGSTTPTSKFDVVGDVKVIGVITATNFVGSGIGVTGVIGNIGIKTAGGTLGTGITFFDFRGVGISSVTVSSGIATINIAANSFATALVFGR